MAGKRELTLRRFAAVRDLGLETMRALTHPEIELESRFSTVAGTIYRGHEGVATWFKDIADAWDRLDVELEDLVEEDNDSTLVPVTLHAVGRESGIEIHERVAQRHHWRGEHLVKVEYVARERAERDVAAR